MTQETPQQAARRITYSVLVEAANGPDPAKAAAARAELDMRVRLANEKTRAAMKRVADRFKEVGAAITAALQPLVRQFQVEDGDGNVIATFEEEQE